MTTTKLHPDNAAELARQINRREVALRMYTDQRNDFRLWFTDYCLATIELSDTFGIDLPSLETNREWLATTRQDFVNQLDRRSAE